MEPETNRPKAKFHQGQIVLFKGRAIPFLEVIEQDGEFYYKWNRKNAAAEHMLREQTECEAGR